MFAEGRGAWSRGALSVQAVLAWLSPVNAHGHQVQFIGRGPGSYFLTTKYLRDATLSVVKCEEYGT